MSVEVAAGILLSWKLAGVVVPIAYVAWSVWLIALGIGLLL